MNAKHVFLTHFSLRYPKMPHRAHEHSERPLALAFDGACIRIGDIWKLEAYLPAIEQHYSSQEDEEVAVAVDMEIDIATAG